MPRCKIEEFHTRQNQAINRERDPGREFCQCHHRKISLSFIACGMERVEFLKEICSSLSEKVLIKNSQETPKLVIFVLLVF
ncbi:MAG: hypothetical protein O4751_01645 [Trichodesmium sp. St2_bin6]|nr:hypothetical protein [Trichodesmium sp. St2_bin6]MDE5102526.1 hypothetical protein [Trichodesmium sp. St19_bin2]